MSMSAAVLRKMMDKGLSIADAIEIAEVWEAGAAEVIPTIDVSAERRRAKDRERKRNVRGMSAECPQTSAERVSPTPPSEITPSPPLKGGISPVASKPPAKPISDWVEQIWEITPRSARARTGKADIERSLKAAMRRDHDPADVLASLEAYYASPDATKDGGKYAKGAHRMIENDRWQAFEADLTPRAKPSTADPWPGRLLAFQRNGYWNTTDWGPKPGKPGCMAPSIGQDEPHETAA